MYCLVVYQSSKMRNDILFCVHANIIETVNLAFNSYNVDNVYE